MNVDMSSSMQMLAIFLARFSGPASYHIKIKYCNLCETICSRTDTLTIRKDSPARYIILDVLLQWMSPKVRLPLIPSEIPPNMLYRHRRHLAQILLTLSIWHVFERVSSCWTVCNFVHTIIPILEMMPYIMFHDFSINIRQRY